MKIDFKQVEEELGSKLIQIDSAKNLNITTVKNIESLNSFVKVLNPNIVLYFKKTINEQIGELIPKVIEADKTISAYLNYLQRRATNEGHSGANCSVEKERYFDFYDALGRLINTQRDEEICHYQLFYPVNGIFLTTGLVIQDWLEYSDLFTGFQDDFIKAVSN